MGMLPTQIGTHGKADGCEQWLFCGLPLLIIIGALLFGLFSTLWDIVKTFIGG